jgi:hypothetical protein
MSFNYEWQDAPLQVTEGQAAWSGGAGWGGYTPSAPANFQVVMRETTTPDSTDVFTFASTALYDPDPTTPPGVFDGQPFEYIGSEVFFGGAKFADFSTPGDGTVVVTFTANSAITDYGAAAGALANDIYYANTQDLAPGETLGQRLELLFIDNGTIVAQDFRDVVVTGTDPMPPPSAGELIEGGKGRDNLQGFKGNDTLIGANGTDRLEGCGGNDQLWGGQGRDVFVFGFDTSAGEVDRIHDFRNHVDSIQLRAGMSVLQAVVTDIDGDGENDTQVTLNTGALIEIMGVTFRDISDSVTILTLDAP